MSAIEKSKNLFSTTASSSDLALNGEIDRFVEEGSISDGLKIILNGLLSISPTSTSVERCFSSCGIVATSNRAYMSEDLLEAIILCKYFFLNEY